MRLTFHVASLAVIVSFSAFAQTAPSKGIPVMSFSDTSCGAWVNSQKNESKRQIYLFWFRGFVSGYNYGSQTHEIPFGGMPDNDTLTLFIDKYCRDNPLNPFISSALLLVKQRRISVSK